MARRKNDAERGPLGAWAYNTRDALDLSVEAVIELLPTTYHPATLRKIEGGTVPPGRRMWRELGALYDRRALEDGVLIEQQPRMAPDAPEATETADALVSAIRDQTRAIDALVGELRREREEGRDVATAFDRAAVRLLELLRPSDSAGSAGRSSLRETA